jgi:hypothetical protein
MGYGIWLFHGTPTPTPKFLAVKSRGLQAESTLTAESVAKSAQFKASIGIIRVQWF